MQTTGIGSKIADRYALQERVGEGRVSSVYRALDAAAGDTMVAVKLLDTTHSDDFKKTIFDRETTALKQLRHSNIVGLQQSGWPDGEEESPYLVLDYLPFSLAGYVSDPGLLPFEFNEFRAMRELAAAVAYAHSRNVIHRDIKPSNILIDRSGRPHLADFGISKLLDELTVGETLAGYWSGGYASPEQRSNRTAGPKSDIYSLGAVFYHILSGRAPPSDGPTPGMVDNDCQAYPIPLRRILRRMLARRPEDRAYSGSDLVVALERITEQAERLPSHPLKVTFAAVRSLARDGYIIRECFDEACEVIRENLGGESRGEVHLRRDPANPEDVQMLCDSIRIICAVDSGVLVVKAVHTPFIPDLERARERAMPYRAIWEPMHRDSVSAANGDLEGLLKALDDHETTSSSIRKQRSSRYDFIQRWLDHLKKRERALAGQGLTYGSVEDRGNYFEFNLTSQPPDGHDWPDDAPLAVGMSEGERQRYVSVGTLVDLSPGSVRSAKPHRGVRKDDIPSSGALIIDPVQERAAIRRQNQACYDFISGEIVNPKLADVVVDPKTATRMPEPSLSYFQDWLSADKKEAVRRAVSSNEMFLIQGPPGTGKTAVIAEIVLQILGREPEARILLSSQSNVAVDHALAQIGNASGDDEPEMIRLGREERIGGDGDNWAIRQRADAMRREVVARCDQVIADLKRSERAIRRSVTKSGTDAEVDWLALDKARAAIADLPASERQVKAWLDTLADALDLDVRYDGSNADDALTAAVDAASAQHGDETDSAGRAVEIDSTRATREIVEAWKEIVGLTPDFMKLIVEQSNVVGATCLYSGGPRMPEADFDWAIIDEAGRATLPETLVPMAKAERTILVGDERQLPPMVEELASGADSPPTHEDSPLDKSLFQSLVEETPPQHLVALRSQFRMHPAVGRLIGDVFYDGGMEQGTNEADHPNYGWMRKPVTWLSTSAAPDRAETRRGRSFANTAEANLILLRLEELERRCGELGLEPSVGVISGYMAQVDQLRRVIDPDNSTRWRQLKVEVATVDSFQGRECDVVIYSTAAPGYPNRDNGQWQGRALRRRQSDEPSNQDDGSSLEPVPI